MLGDVVVTFLPYGGIYLFGNITNQYVEYLKKPDFMVNYISHRSYMSEVFKNVPIYVVKKTDLGIEGAYEAGKHD